jgi:hypothetical protein
MEFSTFQEKSKNIKRGKYTTLEFKSIKAPTKAFKDYKIEKVTSGVFRLGISYARLEENKGRETFNKMNGEWVPEMHNLVSTYKDNLKLRVYTTKNYKHKRQVKWYLNGEETTYKYLIDNGIMKDENKSSSGPLLMFDIKLDNLIKIGA